MKLDIMTQALRWEYVTEVLISKYHITPEDMADLHYAYFETLRLAQENNRNDIVQY